MLNAQTHTIGRRGKTAAAVIAGAAMLALSMPAQAAEQAAPTVTKCPQSLGSIAVVDGDTQGWTKYGLGSPRELIAALATESGCFTLHNPASGTPANYLFNVIAGDKEEVDRGVEMAKTAAAEGLIRSGAAGGLLGRVPMGGAMLGMLGGLGGKKKTVAAGIRVISPATGMTMIAGSGEVKKSSMTFGGIGGGGGWASGADASGYASSKDGRMLVEAFIKAYNSVVAQSSALGVASAAPAAAAASAKPAIVAVETRMYSAPAATSSVVRTLRPSTTLTPSGRRDGLFIEVSDSFGTKGWVSVEALQ